MVKIWGCPRKRFLDTPPPYLINFVHQDRPSFSTILNKISIYLALGFKTLSGPSAAARVG